ncbi:hypothetical protein N665_0013s0034 [Sinapis alba]|nr:hypothetical protein N665_0013s0034 [Sinapis alba]
MAKSKSKKKSKVSQEPDPPQNAASLSLSPILFLRLVLLLLRIYIASLRRLITLIFSPNLDDLAGSLQPDLRLPPRLFVTDRFPTKRLNIYSSPEILSFLSHVLRDTPEFQTIRESCFGNLFDIPAQFGTVTGLNYSSFPDGYHPDTAKYVVAGKDVVWKRLFGRKKIVTIVDLCQMLEKEPHMSGWKKIRITLIIIVDGVLIAHKQEARPTPRYVSMLQNLPTFFAFPWDRESFLKTISCMKPPNPTHQKCNDPVDWLVRKLKQRSFRLQSFPLTLQLVAFRAIPQLLSYIPAPLDNLTLMDLADGYLPQHHSINSLDIRRFEFSSDVSKHALISLRYCISTQVNDLILNYPLYQLVVSPIILIESQEQPGWEEWSNDFKDDNVIYMEQLIVDRYTFNKAMCYGGVTTEPLLKKPKDRRRNGKKDSTRVKKSLKPKTSIKNESSSRMQRRISSYFTSSSATSFTNAQLSDMVLKLHDQMKEMHKLLNKKKKMKQKAHGRQTSFHTLISRNKNPGTSNQDVPHTSHHSVEPEPKTPRDDDPPTDQDVPHTSHSSVEPEPGTPLDDTPPTDQDMDAMETDEHPESQSPIVSFKRFDFKRIATTHPPTASSPVRFGTIHTQLVHDSSDHNTTTVHTSFVHASTTATDMLTVNPNSTIIHQDDKIQKTPPPQEPNQKEPNSTIYDKSDHPNISEIHHILFHGPRPTSIQPTNIRLYYWSIISTSHSFTIVTTAFYPLTSPVKSNDSGLGFVGHAATPNAFTATTSSNSPPCIGRPTSVEKSQVDEDEVVDLTQTKDPLRHVPSMEEDHLVREFFISPLISALDLITPLPHME